METDLPKLNSEIEDIIDSLLKLVVKDCKHEEKRCLNESSERVQIEEANKMHFSHESGDGFVLPDDELVDKILNQVEYFFSDVNIWKDKFFLERILRSKEGYVDIQLIASLSKVNALTKDWRVVVQSLKNSKKLEMNEEMNKVRRVNPLSEIANTANSGSVMVFELPSKVQTSDDIKEILKPFGPVTHALLLSSNSDSLSPHMKRRLSFYKHISSTTFAVAKFQSVEDSAKAIRHIPNAEHGFLVVPLINGDNVKISPNLSSEECQPTLSSKYKSDSPWKKRKQLSSGCDKQRVIVIRQPKGPDDTIGFHVGRSKMNLTSPKIE